MLVIYLQFHFSFTSPSFLVQICRMLNVFKILVGVYLLNVRKSNRIICLLSLIRHVRYEYDRCHYCLGSRCPLLTACYSTKNPIPIPNLGLLVCYLAMF
jgi:hypothetical protein